ncbi:MAG: disulfide bond formation protein B [Aquabacterium sp.]
MNKLTPRLLLVVIGLACVAAVGAALVAQYHFHMEPCPWCILQRILFLVVGALCLVASALSGLVRRIVSALAVPFAIGGIAAALWQHFVAAKSDSCALTLADKIITGTGLDARWPDVFEVRGSCADAAVNVLGVPFEFWSLALFALAGIVALRSALTVDRRA